MLLSFKTYIIVLPLVFFAAVVDAIGGGGGLISLPAYTLAGLDYGFASGCNKFSACCATTASFFSFLKSGRIQLWPALCAAIGALPGAFLGTKLSMLLGTDTMRVVMICATPCVAAFLLLKKDTKPRQLFGQKLTYLICALVGLLTGFYDGFFGPGTGTFLILLFNSLCNMEMVTASANAKAVNLASNLTSLVTRIFAHQVIFALAIPAACLSICGGLLGTRLALTKGAKIIRYTMLFVLALLMVKLIVDLF